MSRSIVLHPGLPKCATSTLQHMFVIGDHALARALGLAVLGKGYMPMNGYPPVTEIMCTPSESMRALHAQDYAPGQYFLSSEALAGRPDFITEISRIFMLSKLVVTVRFPPAQALSNFRYSGWITEDLHSYLANPSTAPLHALHRHTRKLAMLTSLGDTLAVPIEGGALVKRFCLACFGQVPTLLSDPPYTNQSSANESIGLGFATALREALLAHGLTVVGTDRARLVKLAQRRKLAPDVARLMPEGFAWTSLAPALGALDGYAALLHEYGVEYRDMTSAVKAAEAQFRAFIAQPCATHLQMDTLRMHAEAVVQAFTENIDPAKLT
jgi:hypothetical protein